MLYNENRPKLFDEIIGQDVAVTIGKNLIKDQENFPNLLLVGLHGSGKTSTALLFARSLNCENPIGENPCGTCNSCIEHDQGTNYDIIEMDGASNNGVDDIRKLRDEIAYPPRRKKKVYIIDEAHRLSKGAFDALLKITEDTPKHVTFILCTTEAEKIPKTIRSRFIRLDYSRIPQKDILSKMVEILKEKQIPYDLSGISLISKIAAGSMRDALSMLEKCMWYGDLSLQNISHILGLVDMYEVENIIKEMLSKNHSEALFTVNQMYFAGKDMMQLADDMLSVLRNLMVLQSTDDERLFDMDISGLKGIKIDEKELFLGMTEFSQTIRSMRNSENAKMILDIGIIKLVNMLNAKF